MPPKRKAPPTTSETERPATRSRTRSTALAENPPPLPPPARRGRSRKAPSPPSIAVGNHKGPTTRARKITQLKSPDDESSENVLESPDKNVVAPRRGRPRKPPTAHPELPNTRRTRVSKVLNSKADNETLPNDEVEKAEDQVEVPMRRGRPHKAPTPLPTARQASTSQKTRAREMRARQARDPELDDDELAVIEETQPVMARIAHSKTITQEPSEELLLHTDAAQESESSADELLLTSSKSRTQLQSTPPRSTAPRLFLHSVEIVTPRGKPTRLSPAESPPQHIRHRKTGEVPEANARTLPLPALPPTTFIPPITPSKNIYRTPHASPSRLPHLLPQHLHSCLNAQKRAVLAALRNPSVLGPAEGGGGEQSANSIALEQLNALLTGTVERAEGNSCLIVGPRGSGKTQIVDKAISSLNVRPLVIRLSGHVQFNDRLAMREIARQLAQQTGKSFGPEADDDAADDENPFLEVDTTISLPPPSHLPALISALPTLSRSTIIILDAFDLFALHGRQALLYCLLDTAQSCRAGNGNNGIAVIGVTCRIDTITLLEKRVKSRFSGRIFRMAGPTKLNDWITVARNMLCPPVEYMQDEWSTLWSAAVEQFLSDRTVNESLSEIFGLLHDVNLLRRILTGIILELRSSAPFPKPSQLHSAVSIQRDPAPFPFLSSLSYPSICLLIATVHARTAGHDSVTFEMLYECFRIQVRTSLSAPVQIEGGGIGMVKCSRKVLLAAFEQLVATKAFMTQAAVANNLGKEFVRYRCMVERDEVKKAVEALGQTNLKKWFFKAQ
ncbi:hypothetical protein EW146_g4982 [Bondarzewia mesenterica]|uniref:Uncharacterized protein n=1 Tax=Bondarzewia mesenterica TaxID=1095465 RepID=A0A4S4LSV0_9AGAM|nr:hypothetical protein EW146_g4982 [Bondarzewia mesenterica]